MSAGNRTSWHRTHFEPSSTGGLPWELPSSKSPSPTGRVCKASGRVRLSVIGLNALTERCSSMAGLMKIWFAPVVAAPKSLEQKGGAAV